MKRKHRETSRVAPNPRHNRQHTGARGLPARCRADGLGLARSILGGGSQRQRHTQPPVRERAQQRRQRLHAATGEGEEERSAWGVMDESIGSEIPTGGGRVRSSGCARLGWWCSPLSAVPVEGRGGWVGVCVRVLPRNRPHSNAGGGAHGASLRRETPVSGSAKENSVPPVEDAGEKPRGGASKWE